MQTSDQSAAPAIPGVASAISSMPEVSEHAIAEAQRQAVATEAAEANAASSATGQKDKAGTLYDPKIHTGSLTKSGRWRLRKNPDGAARSTSIAPSQTPASAESEADKIAKAQAFGQAFSDTIALAFTSAGGDWELSEAERAATREAWSKCALAYGWTDAFPPWAGLVIAYSAPIGKRMMKPERRQSIKQRLAAWWIGRQEKKRAARMEQSTAELGPGE